MTTMIYAYSMVVHPKGWVEMNGLGESGSRGSVGTTLSDLETVVSHQGWVREWRILIWTWTIWSEGDDCFVETMQHRFLGQEIIHRYSRTLWMVMVWSAIIATAAVTILTAVLALLSASNGEFYGPMFVMLGLLCLPLILALVVVVYFTYVPPKEHRTSGGG